MNGKQLHPEKSQAGTPARTFSRNLPWDYFLLVFALTIPFWLLSALLGNELPIPINLPISALAFLTPLLAASILTYRREGSHGVKELLKRAFDYRRITNQAWYIPALLLIPLVYLLSCVIMHLAGLPLPDPVEVPLLWAPVLFIVFFIGAVPEELGWSGYALDPLQHRWGALTAAIVVGAVWQAWHIIGDLQAGHGAAWIVWHSLLGVGTRILMVWVYNNTGRSVFATILMHASDNVGWTLFPNYGSHYDPFIPFVITTVMAAAVTFLWGARTLARFRFAPPAGS